LITGFDPLGETHLVGGRQQRHTANVLEEQLQRIRGLLDGRGGTAGSLGLVNDLGGTRQGLRLLQELNASLFELLIDELGGIRIKPKSIEYLGDLFQTKKSQLLAAHNQSAKLSVILEYAQLLRRHPPPVSALGTVVGRS